MIAIVDPMQPDAVMVGEGHAPLWLGVLPSDVLTTSAYKEKRERSKVKVHSIGQQVLTVSEGRP